VYCVTVVIKCAVKEQGDVQSSVEEALVLLVDCFTDVDAARTAQLEALVLQNIEQVVIHFSCCNVYQFIVYKRAWTLSSL